MGVLTHEGADTWLRLKEALENHAQPMDWAGDYVFPVFYAFILFALTPIVYKSEWRQCYVMCEYFCYNVCDHEANNSYPFRWEVKDAGVDSKSDIYKSIVFEGVASSVPGRDPTRGLYISKVRLSRSSLWEHNIQSPLLPTSVHFLKKWIDPAIMLPMC